MTNIQTIDTAYSKIDAIIQQIADKTRGEIVNEDNYEDTKSYQIAMIEMQLNDALQQLKGLC